MKKLTCTFPNYQFRRVTRNEDVKIGDVYNHQRPPYPFTDNWEDVGALFNWNGSNVKMRKGWIVIRPL